MANTKRESDRAQTKNFWWEIADLIAALDAGPAELAPMRKCLLFLIQRHTHSKQGYAWASQATLAKEMGVSLSTVERAFRWAKETGVVTVKRVRRGKRPADQHNEYTLNIGHMKELRRTTKHPAVVTVDKPESEPEHPASMTDTRSDHPAPMTGDTHRTPRTEATRTPRTGDGEGLKKAGSRVPSGVVTGNTSVSGGPSSGCQDAVSASEKSKTAAVSSLEQLQTNLSGEFETFMRGHIKEIHSGKIVPIEEAYGFFSTRALALGARPSEVETLFRAAVETVCKNLGLQIMESPTVH
jgi:hypothetical protein